MIVHLASNLCVYIVMSYAVELISCESGAYHSAVRTYPDSDVVAQPLEIACRKSIMRRYSLLVIL